MPRFVELDVTDRARWAAWRTTVGPVHILVNNAGVSVFGPTDEASYADYDWIMGVNFGGVVNGLVTFVPRIKAQGQGGHVVNVASMAAYLSGPQAGIYTASKFAVRGLTECLRYNLAPYGIGVSLDVSRADPDQCLGLGVEAPGGVRGLGLRAARSRRARAVRHRVRGRHGPARGGRKDARRDERESRP